MKDLTLKELLDRLEAKSIVPSDDINRGTYVYWFVGKDIEAPYYYVDGDRHEP